MLVLFFGIASLMWVRNPVALFFCSVVHDALCLISTIYPVFFGCSCSSLVEWYASRQHVTLLTFTNDHSDNIVHISAFQKQNTVLVVFFCFLGLFYVHFFQSFIMGYSFVGKCRIKNLYTYAQFQVEFFFLFVFTDFT